MADFPRYDGHLYIDAYEGNIVRDWYVGRDLYVSDDAEITNNLTVTAGNFRVNAGTATVYGSITTTVGDFIALSGDASLTNDTASTHGLTITSANVLGQPSIFLTESTGKTTTLKTTDTGLTEFWSDGNMKLGYESSTPQSLSIYAGAGTDPFASEAFKVATTNSSGTTFTDGTITFNASSDDMDFIVNTSTIPNAFKIDSGAFSAEFNAYLITKSDVFMETANYTGLTTPGVRINHPGDRYENRLLTTFYNDFSIESTSFTGVTPALRLNYTSDTLTVRVPTTLTSTLDVTGATTLSSTLDVTGLTTFNGDVTHTAGTTVDFTGTTVLGLPSSAEALDGAVTWNNTGTGAPTPDLTVDDGSRTIRAWEWFDDGVNMRWKVNPDSDSGYITEFYSENGYPDLTVDQGGVNVDGRVLIHAEQLKIFPRPVGDGGTGGYVEYYISDGTKVMEWNLEDAAISADKGYRFDVKDSITGAGKFELNTTSQSDMDFVVNTSTIADTFYIDFGDDSLAFKGVLAEPFPVFTDTATNLPTTLTKEGSLGYDTTNSELSMRSNGSNHYVLTPLVHSFTFNFPTASVTVAGPFNPVANGGHAKNGVTALWDGYIVGFSVEVEDVPGSTGTIADFRPRVNGTNLLSLSAQVNATGNFEATATAAPNAVTFSSGDRLTAALEQIIGIPTNAMDDVLAQLYVVYKIPVL